MKDKNVIFSLCLILVVLAIFISRLQHEPKMKEAFERRPSHLIYTKRALCLMGCFHVSRQNIKEIMESGIIHFSLSNRSERPCPKFVLQGRASNGQTLRIVFTQCPGETKVEEVIPLHNTIECNCPMKSG